MTGRYRMKFVECKLQWLMAWLVVSIHLSRGGDSECCGLHTLSGSIIRWSTRVRATVDAMFNVDDVIDNVDLRRMAGHYPRSQLHDDQDRTLDWSSGLLLPYNDRVHVQSSAKTGPSYLIANILKTPWPNYVEIGELLQYYMLNTVIDFLFKNFITLWRHLAKTQLLCDAQIYLYSVNKWQQHFNKIHKIKTVTSVWRHQSRLQWVSKQENICNISTQYGRGVFRIFAMR